MRRHHQELQFASDPEPPGERSGGVQGILPLHDLDHPVRQALFLAEGQGGVQFDAVGRLEPNPGTGSGSARKPSVKPGTVPAVWVLASASYPARR